MFYTLTDPNPPNTFYADVWGATWNSTDNNPLYTRGAGGYEYRAAPFKPKKCCCDKPCAGDPVDLATGGLAENVKDYETVGPNKLGFERYYNYNPDLSEYDGSSYIPTTFPTALGLKWRSSFDRYLRSVSWNNQLAVIVAERADGSLLSFGWNGSQWVTDSDTNVTLMQSGNTFTLVDNDDTAETYTLDSTGKGTLTSIRARNGYAQTLNYNSSGQLASVIDSYGRALQFRYQNGLLSTLTTPDGLVLSYGYIPSGLTSGGAVDLLASVSYSTNPISSQSYLYENASFPTALTGITDENGNRFATWSYDGIGRVLSSQHAGGADLTNFSHYSPYNTAIATNALGQPVQSWFESIAGAPKLIEVDRNGTNTTAAATRLIDYDSNGYRSSETDWNGNQATYVNDARGRPTTVTQAVGTPQQRVTQVTWHSIFNLPTRIVAPGLTTTFTYDANGNLLSRTQTDTTTNTTTNGQTRTWQYTWTNFLPTSITDPRGSTIQFGWDTSGALVSVTNSLGQVTRITQHLPGGLPQVIIDPNGVETDLAYDVRNRLLSRIVRTAAGPLTTTYSYDAAGNRIQTTLPDGSALANSYDAAHRLTAIGDLLGNLTAFTLDALGNRTGTNWSTGNTLTRTHSATFDSLGRILQDIGGVGQTTTYTYDPNGNVTNITDPLGHPMSQAFDALNRPVQQTDAMGGITATGYDPQDNPVTVTDPNGNTTTYVYDGFGDVITQISPDSGTTLFSYDASGNLVQRVDARGAVTNYVYDRLNRLTAKSFPANPAENITYTYDEPGHGFSNGRLTTVLDNGGSAGTVSYSYDERGNVLSETRTYGGVVLSTAYVYDAAGRVRGITYPSGAVASYTRDAMGRVAALSVTPPGGSAQAVVSGVSYQPFGPVSALTYGNGITDARNFDLDYRPTAITYSATGLSWNLRYSYDLADNVIAVTDNVFGNQSFGYDQLNRLVQGSGWYGSGQASYDPVGNISSFAGESMSYAGGTNRLASVSVGGNPVRTLGYNATGNIISDQRSNKALTLRYNQANRLANITVQPTGGRQSSYNYFYDDAGQRLAKVLNGNGGTVSVYQYDRAGYLLEETSLTSGTPKPLADYLYVDGRPVATLSPNGTLLYLHTDRLGTPQAATTASQQGVWVEAYSPFGGTKPLVNLVPQNLRFPGQYVDAESGFYHNGFRDYDPTIGRYIQSDPIGLEGGLNTYLYAFANPTNLFDRMGLDTAPYTAQGYRNQYLQNQKYIHDFEDEIKKKAGLEGIVDIALLFTPEGILFEGIKHGWTICEINMYLEELKKYDEAKKGTQWIVRDWRNYYPKNFNDYFKSRVSSR